MRRTSKDMCEAAKEAVLWQWRQGQSLLREAAIALEDCLAACGIVSAVQLQINSGEVHLPEHHGCCLVCPVRLFIVMGCKRIQCRSTLKQQGITRLTGVAKESHMQQRQQNYCQHMYCLSSPI